MINIVDNGYCPFCNHQLKFMCSISSLKQYRCTTCAKRSNIHHFTLTFKIEPNEKDYILRGISGLSKSTDSCYFKGDKWTYRDFEITWSTIPELREKIQILDLFD